MRRRRHRDDSSGLAAIPARHRMTAARSSASATTRRSSGCGQVSRRAFRAGGLGREVRRRAVWLGQDPLPAPVDGDRADHRLRDRRGGAEQGPRFTGSLVVYREVTREIPHAGRGRAGVPAADAGLEQVQGRAAGNATLGDRLVAGWIAGLDKADFELEAFGRVLRQGPGSAVARGRSTFAAACRWLDGEVGRPRPGSPDWG